MYIIREISRDEYWRFLRTYPDASYQQTPEWGDARSAEWEPRLIGWFDSVSQLCAAAVLRYRQLPGLSRWFVFIPQGPLLDWTGPHLSEQLEALRTYLSSRGVFGVRITPMVSLRKWDAATVKAGLADPDITRISAMEATEVNLSGISLVSTLGAAGWREAPAEKRTSATYPRFNYWLDLAGRSEQEVLDGTSKSWRHNVRKAERGGIAVTSGSRDDLEDVHRLYSETARRQKFPAHPRAHFEAMWESLGNGFPGYFNLKVAHFQGSAVAASATAQVGSLVQSLFAATSTERTGIRPSNAVWWALIRQAIADGAELFDLGGVADTLEEHDPTVGLVRFKAGMGADVHEYMGAWDLPLQPQLYAAFTRLLPLAQVRKRAAWAPKIRRR
ncbi:lipid II:glycine glycyltransferase FemX [Nesterenkonia natronophila]|uniref:lipid II:glycine glycyltransferase FemX n=1 Tax=Nesterenkonia natronophila TaxID=2174932 RepID=UPI001314A86A|nr:peptidoglycan bridge formation glycyltransferase FemA/FemB family protein [Nesterenkonia natronophila]